MFSKVTVLSSTEPGQAVLGKLEKGLKDSDLVSLRRLVVVHIAVEQNLPDREQAWSPESCSTEIIEKTDGQHIHFGTFSSAHSV